MSAPRSKRSAAPGVANISVVAEAAGVSAMTVSRVLRHSGYAAPDTRARVLEAVEKLGYRPNPMVSALMTRIRQGKLSQPDNVIAYLTSSRQPNGWRANETYRRFFQGASDRARRRGYQVEEFRIGERGFSAARLSRVLYSRGIRGVIVGPLVSPHGHLNLKWSNFSAVAIGYSLLRPALDRVSNDQYDSMLTMLRELRRLGYRRVGVASRGDAAERVHYRWPSAFLIQQWRLGSMDKSLLYFPAEWRRDGFLAWFQQARPDAVVTLEAEVYPWLVAAGYRVPDEVGLALLDWSPREKPLAGIDQGSAAVGASAADVVIERVNNNDLGVPSRARTIVLSGDWIAGATVRPAAPTGSPLRKRP